jgi:hypothetical protein
MKVIMILMKICEMGFTLTSVVTYFQLRPLTPHMHLS